VAARFDLNPMRNSLALRAAVALVLAAALLHCSSSGTAGDASSNAAAGTGAGAGASGASNAAAGANYNAAMPALIKTRAESGKHIILVDMYSAFTADANYRNDYMNGSLHPNDAGYNVMGDIWYAALASHW
jgi:hypothetical protein